MCAVGGMGALGYDGVVEALRSFDAGQLWGGRDLPSPRYPRILGSHGGPCIPESLFRVLWLCEGPGGLYVMGRRERICGVLEGDLGWSKQRWGVREDFVWCGGAAAYGGALPLEMGMGSSCSLLIVAKG